MIRQRFQHSAEVSTIDPVIRGICPVLEVPFDDQDRVDLGDLDRLVDHVLAAGVGGIMFPGYASEFLKLTESERDDIETRLLARTADSPVPLVLSVSDHGTVPALERARRFADAGVAGINLLPPYLLGVSADQVRAHVVAVADAIAPVPVVLQYAPAQTGTALSAPAIRELATHSANLRQVKVESSPPGPMIEALLRGEQSVPAAVGYAGLGMIDALERGAVCVQPGCSFTELYVRVWTLWHDGERDAARTLHTRMVPYLSYWMAHVELIVAAEKLISARRGLISSARCRMPGHLLDVAEVAAVDRFLAEFADELAALH